MIITREFLNTFARGRNGWFNARTVIGVLIGEGVSISKFRALVQAGLPRSSYG